MTSGKWSRWLMAAGLALGLAKTASAASPTNPAYLDLRVTFSGNLSVKVDGMGYSTRTLTGTTANAKIVPGSATVTNDSGGLIEQFGLTVATVSGGGNWAVQGTTATAPGVDQYAFQALFISSHTTADCTTADFDSMAMISTVTATQAFYRSSRYANQALVGSVNGNPDVATGAQNGNMYGENAQGNGRRGLCVRFYMPSGSVSPAEQVVRLTITATNGL